MGQVLPAGVSDTITKENRPFTPEVAPDMFLPHSQPNKLCWLTAAQVMLTLTEGPLGSEHQNEEGEEAN